MVVPLGFAVFVDVVCVVVSVSVVLNVYFFVVSDLAVVVSVGLFSDEVTVVVIFSLVEVTVSVTMLISELWGSRWRAFRISSFFQIPMPAMRTAAIPEAIRVLRLKIIARRFFSSIRSSALRKTLSATCL